MDDELRKVLEHQQYGVVGNHSAVKVCKWTKEQLAAGRGCYKNTFYGIQSHRCLQMTPMATYCNKTCLYCWRYQGWERQVEGPFDEPRFVLDESIRQQNLLLTGAKGDSRVSPARWLESQSPKHVAISLTGEPTFYPYLSGFLAECHARGITTYLVTNGTTPEVLAKLDPPPTQLYVSFDSPDEVTFHRLGVPTTPRAWEKLNETLRMLPALRARSRTVVRHTVIKGWNAHAAGTFARMDARAQPDFIECKAYEYVGYSRERMTWDNVPLHEEVLAFAQTIRAALGYELAGERRDSRVVLLKRPGSPQFLWEDPRSQPVFGSTPPRDRTPSETGIPELAIGSPTGLGAAPDEHLHVVHEHDGSADHACGGGCGGGANARLRAEP
ncbi:MAG TPA: 4-demethylwyosine synthase TYW1 [Candidatus Thermoplasmatota archaeon]|nr:4-demethylwyosine synthase TYW1 [Candidatus Thermoplasmatota archaeon]